MCLGRSLLPLYTIMSVTKNLSAVEIRSVHQKEMESIHLQDLRKQTSKDESYQKLKQSIMEGFLDHQYMLPDETKPFWQLATISLEEKLIVYGCRLVVPHPFNRQVLLQLY